ncbi:MAG: LamG domain-containing protein, partial [Flavobacteriales bacterium]
MRILISLGILFSLSANAQLSNGLVGYWKLNGDLLDASGNNLHATTNLPLSPTVNRSGGEGCALYGTDFDVLVPISPLFLHDPTGAFSVSIWMKRESESASLGLRGTVWPSGNQGWQVYMNATDGLSFGNFSQPNVLQADSTLIAFDNAWHHYVGIYNNHDWSLYYDGQLLLQDTTTTADVGTGTGDLDANVIGGDIDDYRYYGRALLPIEIDSLFNEQPDCANITSIS